MTHDLSDATDLLFLFDACPWGLGGVLVHRGNIIPYFISAPTPKDERTLNIKIGSSSAQQAAECLAVLVGMRAWMRFWKDRRCTPALKGDNKTALNMALTLRGAAGPVKKIARELSFTYSQCSFEPRTATHIPGVANVVSDSLSRKSDPAHRADWQLPACLQHVPQENIAARSASFWLV